MFLYCGKREQRIDTLICLRAKCKHLKVDSCEFRTKQEKLIKKQEKKRAIIAEARRMGV